MSVPSVIIFAAAAAVTGSLAVENPSIAHGDNRGGVGIRFNAMKLGSQVRSQTQSPAPASRFSPDLTLPVKRIRFAAGETGTWISGSEPAAYLIYCRAGERVSWRVLGNLPHPKITAFTVDGWMLPDGGTVRVDGDVRLEVAGTDYGISVEIR